MKDLSSHMMDIVQNSIRAEASWIQIRICEDPEADLFLIEIQDNGCGMDEALSLIHIFQFLVHLPLLLQS